MACRTIGGREAVFHLLHSNSSGGFDLEHLPSDFYSLVGVVMHCGVA